MATAPVEPAPPRLGQLLKDRIAGLVDEATWTNVELAQDLSGQTASGVEFRECRFVSANLTSVELPRLRMFDSEFVGCEASGALFEQAVLTRARFQDCRMRGLILSLAELRDVEFVDCLLDDLQLRMATGARVVFRECSLVGADFYSSQLPDSQLLHCDLSGAEFSKAQLPRGRLHGSKLDALRGVGSLGGVTIDWSQVVPLGRQALGALGITVDSDGDAISE